MEKIRPFVQERKRLSELLPLAAPLAVVVEMGDSCNFKCRFCYNSKKESKSNSHFSKELFIRLIAELAMFSEPIDTLRITGDVEPLQHPQFTEFIRIAKQSGNVKTIRMSTNAFLLTPGLSRDIIDSGMDIIQISINGMDNEHYKYVTNTDVDFSSIKENVEYLYSIKEQAHIHIKCIGDFFTDEQRHEFMSVFTPLCDTINIEWMVNQWLDMDLDTAQGQNRFKMNTASSQICTRPFYSLGVHITGDVNSCTTTLGPPLSLGNVNDSTLYDIWNGKPMYDLRMAFLKGDYKEKYPNCAKCKFPEFQSSEDLTPYRGELIKKYEKWGK